MAEALMISIGVQDAESRMKARNLKGKVAESDNGNGLVELKDIKK